MGVSSNSSGQEGFLDRGATIMSRNKKHGLKHGLHPPKGEFISPRKSFVEFGYLTIPT